MGLVKVTVWKSCPRVTQEGEEQLKNDPRDTKRREGRKESRQNCGWGVDYPQFCTFCLLVVYNIFFKFSILPKLGVGVKSNTLMKQIFTC